MGNAGVTTQPGSENWQWSFPDKMKTKLWRGEMAEWLKARASKACIP